MKDPRLSWFLGLWRVAAIRTGATPVFATMLRPPAEVVGSKQKYYANKLGSAHLAASWVNMLLHTERATRPAEGDGGRVFVRYEDLLTDWVKTTTALGHALDLQTIIHTRSDQIREVHRFIDPHLRRVTSTLDDLALPQAAARPHRRDVGAAQQARRRGRRHRRGARDVRPAARGLRRPLRGGRGDQPLDRRARPPPGPPPGAGREAATEPRSLADRVPHDVRATIPPSVRRGVRKALGRERGRPGSQ